MKGVHNMNRILPIGSVVRIKDVKDPRVSGCFISITRTAIEEVLFEGYRNDDFKHIELLLGLRLVQYISEGKLQ